MKETEKNPSEKQRDKRFMEKLREHPHLRERFEVIMELTRSESGPIRKADQVEELLVEEVRKLGNRAMQDWAQGAEARAAEQLKRETPGTRSYKKKP